MRALLEKLDEIEAEMKAINYWLSTGYLSGQPQCFEQWLQFTFLPTARRRISLGDLPKDSQVGVMAMREYDYHSHVPEAQHLYGLLCQFDSMVKAAA